MNGESHPFLSLTIARNEHDVGAPKRKFSVVHEMSSASRPDTPSEHKKSQEAKIQSGETLGLDVELALARGPAYRFCLRFLPIFLGVFCGVMAVCTAYVDFNARWSYTTQARYAGFARVHDEVFRPQHMPTIFKVVDIMTDYRNRRDMVDLLALNEDNVTPQAKFLSKDNDDEGKKPFQSKPLDLLAIGQARVSAEAVRSEDERPWNLFVPRTITELVQYSGDAFVDAIILAGEDQAFFPVAKSYSFLHSNGILVHQIPPHVDGRPIFSQYQKLFGHANVRSQFVAAGSRVIIANKEEFIPVSEQIIGQTEMEGYSESNLILDYHYLVM